jgi:signal transduction histidine kinase
VLKIWESNNARALAGEVVRGEVKYRQNGEERTYLNILAPVRDGDELYGVVGLNLDVTDEKRLALELERHQRLESVGVLAGGIAHDFNNYLTVILSGLSALQMRAEQPVDQAAILADLKQAALSARALTRQLLTFAKGSAPVRAPTDIGQIVSEAAGLAIRGSSCLLETQIDPELPLVDADAEQLRQVVHNLVLNAVQSMSTGGMVRVVVGRTGGAQGGPDLVEIAVHDQGIGIPQELLGRVLEPYFTTKQEGQGLGLAICYSIVKKHGGCLSIDSKVGQGTKVFVRLPCSGAESVTAPEAPGANRQDSS